MDWARRGVNLAWLRVNSTEIRAEKNHIKYLEISNVYVSNMMYIITKTPSKYFYW